MIHDKKAKYHVFHVGDAVFDRDFNPSWLHGLPLKRDQFHSV